MKVTVVFHLPDGAGLLSCDLSELGHVPSIRSTYPFNGKVYQVDRILETIGRKPDGTRKNTSEQLVELLAASNAITGKTSGFGAEMLFIKHIGEPDVEVTNQTAGSSLVVATGSLLAKESDRLILLKMSFVALIPAPSEHALESLLKKAERLAAAPQAAAPQTETAVASQPETAAGKD